MNSFSNVPEEVDFEKHDCEEYPGKQIVINDVPYEIGPYLGMGGSKIAYRLINRKSQISHNVIKLYFGHKKDALASARYEVEYGARAKHILNSKESSVIRIPGSFMKESNNGVYLVEEYMYGGFERYSVSHAKELEACEKLLKSNSPDALEALETLRTLLPHDTVLLHNLASLYFHNEELGKAFELQSAVLSIEPHWHMHYYLFIEICFRLNLFRDAIFANNRLRDLYPYSHQSDDLILYSFLSAGRPEKAEDFLSQMAFKSEEEKTEAFEIVKKNKELKAETEAVYESVFNCIKENNYEKGLRLLKKALQIYHQDYFLIANYAFFQGSLGNYKEASNTLLLLTDRVFEIDFHLIFLANAIYYGLMSDEPQNAVLLLEQLHDALERAENGNDNPLKFPSVALFTFRGGPYIEKSYSYALNALSNAKQYVNERQNKYLDFLLDHLNFSIKCAADQEIPQADFDYLKCRELG